MNAVVVDASVLVAASIDQGPDGLWAEDLIETGELVTPHLATCEATNILRRLELAGGVETREATLARRDLMQLDLVCFPFGPFAERVWELRSNVTSYDAWYVAVAESLCLPLATLDRRLARAPGPMCEFLLPE